MNWYEDEELWQTFYDCMFDENSFIHAKQQIPQLLNLAKPDIKTILDLGCGPGRHCLPLAEFGFDVTGLDSSAYLLSKAQEKAKEQNLNINFIQKNMLDYQAQNSFDLIINMFNSFGYFQTHEQNQQVINNAYNNLTKQGTFIIDTVGKETLARIIEPVHLTEYENGDIRIERPLLIDDMQVFSNEWMLIKDDKVHRFNYQHFVYTPLELTHMCQKAGFLHIEVYGSLHGDAYDLDSERLVVVASK
ncbi:MAG TPA: class I SAM-dependent methyltransferase [Oceanospirillales bacterium]|nr:class I SAM-dependent methyltransferase [Oceanospirillales bacterium]